MSHLLYSLIRFVIALFFILIGIVGILIPWSLHVRTLLTKFIFEDALAISLFGFTFFVIGLALATHVMLSTKRRYYEIKSPGISAVVNEAVIQDYLKTYWKQLFPTSDIPCHITFKDNKIHIVADLPYLPIQEQRPLTERIRTDLAAIFTKTLGYNDDLFLSVSFQNQPKKMSCVD